MFDYFSVIIRKIQDSCLFMVSANMEKLPQSNEFCGNKEGP